MPENRFVGEVARRYDHDAAAMFAPDVLEATVDRLEALADGGPVLEFAVGTGRVALRLAARGLDVSGIELSTDMVAELRARPGGADLAVTVGDMTSARVDGGFSLVFLVFNTITNLTSQDEQVRCFENAARHLGPGGRFVVENGVPPWGGPSPRTDAIPFSVTDDHIGIDQLVDGTHRQISRSIHLRRRADGTWSEFSAPFRYVWPAELDLMARLAGFGLEHRWAGWDGSPFTATSTSHVSVWRRVGSR